MNTFATAAAHHLAASGKTAVAVVGLVVVGVALVGGIIWAFGLGSRMRRREPAPPRPDEQPQLPPDGPVGDVSQVRQPNEMPQPADGHRLNPHELNPTGGRDSEDQSRPRWNS